MAYEVTATRRRPQKLEDLVGQDFVAATLKNSIENERIAHAYLFSGPRGCGKTSTARILAKALNCKNGPAPNPCGECENCIEITRGTNTDVIEIDGASNTSVNDIRQIKDEILFAPQSSKYKIYIIDEVHMLSTSAFNALLKTIEEPPPYVIFIFATTELQKVPATIKSRCQQFNFRLVSIEKVKNLLSDAANEIKIKADDEALFWIARESTGSIRDAYTLFDQVAAFSEGHITYEKIRDKLGLLGVERLNDIFEKCASGEREAAIETLDGFLQSGISIEQLISNSTDFLRSLLLIKCGIEKESLLGQSAQRFSKKILDSWSEIQIERAISIFLQLYRDIRYSLSPRYEAELAFSRLSWLSSYVSAAEVKNAIDSAKNLLLKDAMPQNNAREEDAKNTTNFKNNFQSDFSSGAFESNLHGGDFANNFQNSGEASFNSISQSNGGASFNGSNSFGANFNNGNSLGASFSENNFQGEKKAQNENDENFNSTPQSQNSNFLNDNFQGEKTSPQTNHPFYNGGAVPPEQTAKTATQNFQKAEEGDAQEFLQNPEVLKERFLSSLSPSESLLASSLSQTQNWIFADGKIFAMANSFQKIRLNFECEKISSKLSEFLKRPVKFVLQDQAQKENSNEDFFQKDLPESVLKICAAFRGEVVAHTKVQNSAEKTFFPDYESGTENFDSFSTPDDFSQNFYEDGEDD